tara:strand:+ start:3131 stop:3982 length:852 start_codon:yes stop_codon:yes gene_type:complete
MYPIIFDFGLVDIFGFQFHLAIYSFGLMMVIAFYTCYFLLNYDLKRMGHDEKLASDMVFWAAFGGIVGSKIYHLLENLDQVLASPNPWSMIFSGSGLVFLGGLMGGTLAVTLLLRKNKLPWLRFADLVAPLLILGYGIGRIGCFLVGDDYGVPTNLPWGMKFSNGLPPSTSGTFTMQFPWVDISSFDSGVLAVHPTQLYEAFICTAIFLFLWNRRLEIKVYGNLFFLYLIFAGAERFFIEFIRTNEKYLLDIFSGSQVISIIMIIIGLYLFNNPIIGGNSDTS